MWFKHGENSAFPSVTLLQFSVLNIERFLVIILQKKGLFPSTFGEHHYLKNSEVSLWKQILLICSETTSPRVSDIRSDWPTQSKGQTEDLKKGKEINSINCSLLKGLRCLHKNIAIEESKRVQISSSKSLFWCNIIKKS